MNPAQSDFIKKTRIKYLKCQQGNEHQGQLMNFICIDPSCKRKGLICPVCQASTHSGHQTLHLKIFLSQIHKNLYESDSDSKQLMNVTEQLRKIQQSKRQMEKTLREMVLQLSDKVKETQQKIHQNYLNLRRIILSQSTVSSKLPELYSLLKGQGEDEKTIINQLNKFSQFLQYKNNKVHVIDNSQKLIQEYQKTSNAVSIHISAILPQISIKLSSLPLKIKMMTGESGKKVDSTSYTFSKNQKASSIAITAQNKAIVLDQDGEGGIAFAQNSSDHLMNKKIAFKVKQCLSGSILLGLADPDQFKAKNYKMSETENQTFNAISSMGFPYNDFDNPSFVFADGDIIDVEWNTEDLKLTFSRRNGIQTFSMFPVITGDILKQNFCVYLVSKGDSVEIVE